MTRIRSIVTASLCTLAAVSLVCCASPASTPSSTVPVAEVSLDAQLLQMLDERRVDTAIVDALLRDANADRRARAALAIGQVKMRARYSVLRQLLVDPDTTVAASAAYALGVGKDTAGIASLARAVAGAPDAVAREAAWSLGEIGEPARAIITVALGDGASQPLTRSPIANRAPMVRAAVVQSAVKLRPVPVTMVTPWLSDASAEVARAAAYVVGRPRLAGGVRALLGVRGHVDAETRSFVARGLAKSAAGDSLGKDARDALATLARDEDAHVRVNAVQSLATYGAGGARELERALGDTDGNVRAAAAEVIGPVFLRDSSAWRRAWRRDSTFRVRQLLLVGARTLGLDAFAAAEKEWSADADWRHRVAVLEARAAEEKSDRVAIARTFLRDADPRVRAASLGIISPAVNDSIARAVAGPLLNDNDVEVRATALTVLARRARAEDIQVGLSAYFRAAKDVDGEARQAALRVIGAAWNRDSARVNGATREQLSAFAAGGSAAERRLVATVTPMSSWARAASSVVSRPLSDYERLVRQWVAPGARQPRAIVHTDYGDITIELYAREAPLIAESFLKLAANGFYKNSYFHRVVPNFVVQDGDSRGNGSGNPGFTLRESFSRRRHDRGAVGLATSGPDTGGSQYYFCLSAQPHLDGAYTVFGEVVDGFGALDRIVQGDRMLRIEGR